MYVIWKPVFFPSFSEGIISQVISQVSSFRKEGLNLNKKSLEETHKHNILWCPTWILKHWSYKPSLISSVNFSLICKINMSHSTLITLIDNEGKLNK